MNMYSAMLLSMIALTGVAVYADLGDEIDGFVDDVKDDAINHISNVVNDRSDVEIWFDEHRVVILATSVPLGAIIIALLCFCCYRCCCYKRPTIVYQQLPSVSTTVVSTGIQGPVIAHHNGCV